MAQTGYTPILIYSSSTGGNSPAAGNLTNSTLGSELAINITDGKLFYKDNGGSVQVIGWKTTPTTAGGTGLTSYTAGDTLYYASGTTLSKLAIGASKTIMTSSGTAPQWSASLDTSQGGTGNTSYTAGDMNYYASGTAFTKLAIGTAYQALQVNAGGTAPSWQPSATSVLTTQGDLLYASAANTLARLAKNTTASRYLSNTGTSNNPAWAQVDLTNGVTGTLPVGNGGTGTATAFTAGSVVFAGASGVYSQNNANFFWDNTNNRLGLGLTNPSYPLEIGMTNSISLAWQRTGVSAKKWGFQSDNDATYLANISDNILVASFFNAGGVSIGNTTNPGASNLSVNNYLLVGATSMVSSGQALVQWNSANAIDGLILYDTDSTAVGRYAQKFNRNGSIVGSIQTTTTATFYVTSSDYRLKNDVAPMTNALQKILELKPVTYKWNADGSSGQGFIAHELAEIVPECVTGEKDGIDNEGNPIYQGIDTSYLIATLTSAIQEQQQMIEKLKADITAIKGN